MTARHAIVPPALHPSDAALVDLSVRTEREWTGTYSRASLYRARDLRVEVAKRGLVDHVLRALDSAPPGPTPTPRPGPVARLVVTPYGRLPSIAPGDLAEPEPPEVDQADVLELVPA